MPWVAIGMAAAGAIAGSMKDRSSSSEQQGSTSGVNLRNFDALNQGQSDAEKVGYDTQLSSFKDLQNLIDRGPGGQDVTANNQFQYSYTNQLQQMMSNIANPNQQQNYQKAQQAFAPQQTALDQQFEQQGIESNRLAARLGRAGNDPILRNKLAQEKTRQQTMLNSQIGAYGQQLPTIEAEHLMGVGNQLSNLRQGLASQAMNNRQVLLGMGQQLASSERQYRLNTADKFGSQSVTGDTSGGGGLKGAISGGIGGFGAGMAGGNGGKSGAGSTGAGYYGQSGTGRTQMME